MASSTMAPLCSCHSLYAVGNEYQPRERCSLWTAWDDYSAWNLRKSVLLLNTWKFNHFIKMPYSLKIKIFLSTSARSQKEGDSEIQTSEKVNPTVLTKHLVKNKIVHIPLYYQYFHIFFCQKNVGFLVGSDRILIWVWTSSVQYLWIEWVNLGQLVSHAWLCCGKSQSSRVLPSGLHCSLGELWCRL